jgi:hypothetical protein
MGDSTDTTYMGMALVGGNAGQFKIGDDGATHLTMTGVGATNAFHVDLNDANTITSGYVQGFYVSMDTSSSTAWSTGNTQGNAFATDISLTKGTVNCEVEGMYVYISGSSNCTLTDAWVSGLTVYIDDLGSSPNNLTGVCVHWNAQDAATTREAVFYCKGETGTPGALLGCGNNMPTYFFRADILNDDGMITLGQFDATPTYALACYVNGSTFYIALHPASA